MFHSIITDGAVAQPCVNSHGLSQWEPFIFDLPPQNRRPLTDRKKIVAGDYVHNFTAVINLVEIRPWGVSGQMGEI